MPAQRNIVAEQEALKTYGQSAGKMPTTPSDWESLHKIAYPSAEKYPDEFKAQNPNWQSLYVSGPKIQTSPTAPAVTPTLESIAAGAQTDKDKATTDRDAAIKQAQEFNTGTGSFFRTLQQAIQAKTGYQQAGTAESELFKKAGLTGFDSLNQSLAMRKSELDSNSNYLTDVLTNMGGIFKTQAANVKLGYDDAVAKYDTAAKAMQDAAKEIADNKAALDRIKLQHDLKLEEMKWEDEHGESSKWQLKDIKITDDEGNEITKTVSFNPTTNEIRELDTTVPSKGKSIIVGEHEYDMSTYATDPNQAKAVEKIINGIGKFNDESELEKYLTSKGSAITAKEVMESSAKYGVPWEMIVGLQQHESGLGTSPVAVNNNNPGGITWSQAYQDSHPGTEKGTPRPAIEGGNYVSFKSMQDGLDATVEQLAKREVSRPEGYYAANSIKNLVASSKYATANQRKAFNKLIDDSMKVGGWSLAFEQAKAWMYNNEFQSSEKKEAKAADDQIMMFDKSQSIIDRVPVSLGPWNKIKEKDIKPWIGMDKDVATAEFRQWAAYGQAALRNGLFGSQLTEGEMNLSKDFLIDLDKDDSDVIKMKIKNLKEVAAFHRDLLYGKTMGIQQKDIPKTGPEMYGSPKSESDNGVKPTQADNDYVKSLGL